MGITKVYAMFTDGSNILVQEQYNYQAVVKGKSDEINTYRAHSYFIDNSYALMQFMQSKGKENEMKNNNVFAAHAPQIKWSHKAVGAENKKRKRKMIIAKAKLTYTAKLQKSGSRVRRYR